VTLLLVDDDRISIDILAEYIKPHLNDVDEVICAYNGDEAFDIIISTNPFVIITDIRMPTISGIELIKKVRSISGYAPKIIIISGYSDFEYAREALKLDVFDYIVKPIDQDILIEKINICTSTVKKPIEASNEDIFEKVQKYISNHLSEPLKLLDIANLFHYNAAYLGRLIKERTGLYFNDYLLKLRVIKAQSLLVNTNHLINKISIDVGFRDPEHFTKRFKKITGLSPSMYRDKHQ
jgi:two-component system, response regulator YesN